MPAPLSRRQLLFSSLSLLAQKPRPNILWLIAEDLGPQLACYGEPLIQTPNIDRLASRGTRYTRAFATCPVCSPSRSAFATGMYQTAIGSHNHRTSPRSPLPAPARHMNDYLRQAGYFTVLSSPPAGKKAKAAGAGTGAAGSGKTDYNFTIKKPFDANDWSQRAPGQPFFAQLTIQESHKGVGWPLGRKLTPRIDPSKIQLPPYAPEHPVVRDEYANFLEAVQLVDRYAGEVLARLDAEGIAGNTIVFFFGDNGRCLFRDKQFLYDGGIHVPLIVRWPGAVAPGQVNDALVSLIDVTAATLAAAGLPVPAHFHGRDFLAPNAAPRTHIFAARDRCGLAVERMRCVRDQQFKYIKNYLPGIPYLQQNLYKEKEYPSWNVLKQLHAEGKLNPVQALFAADRKPAEELYDLHADPHEVNNLAALPAHAHRLLAMRKLVDQWVLETNDRGAVYEDPVAVIEANAPGANQK